MENIRQPPHPPAAANVGIFTCGKCGLGIALSNSFICCVPLVLPFIHVGALFTKCEDGNILVLAVDGHKATALCAACREIIGCQFLQDDVTMPFIKANMTCLSLDKLNYVEAMQNLPTPLFVDCFLCGNCTSFIAWASNVMPFETAQHFAHGRVVVSSVSNVELVNQVPTAGQLELNLEGFDSVECANCPLVLGWKQGVLGPVNLNLTNLWLRHFNMLIPAELLIP